MSAATTASVAASRGLAKAGALWGIPLIALMIAVVLAAHDELQASTAVAIGVIGWGQLPGL